MSFACACAKTFIANKCVSFSLFKSRVWCQDVTVYCWHLFHDGNVCKSCFFTFCPSLQCCCNLRLLMHTKNNCFFELTSNTSHNDDGYQQWWCPLYFILYEILPSSLKERPNLSRCFVIFCILATKDLYYENDCMLWLLFLALLISFTVHSCSLFLPPFLLILSQITVFYVIFVVKFTLL